MTLIFKQVFRLLHLLSSETATRQIALGFALGAVLGTAAGLTPQALVVFVMAIVLRVQLGAVLVAAFFFGPVAFLLDPLFHSLGSMALHWQALAPVWTQAYNAPILPFTRFYNTLVMGQWLLALPLGLLVYWVANQGIARYRATFVARMRTTRFWRFWKASKFYHWYDRYAQFRH